MNKWSSPLDRRAAGEVPGFLGNDETIEDFVDRTRHEPEEKLEPAPQPEAGLSAAAKATLEVPTKKAPAKAPAAKRSSSSRRR